MVLVEDIVAVVLDEQGNIGEVGGVDAFDGYWAEIAVFHGAAFPTFRTEDGAASDIATPVQERWIRPLISVAWPTGLQKRISKTLSESMGKNLAEMASVSGKEMP